MKQTEIRTRIPGSLIEKFRIICIKKKISSPKQIAELIRKFVEVCESDIKLGKE